MTGGYTATTGASGPPMPAGGTAALFAAIAECRRLAAPPMAVIAPSLESLGAMRTATATPADRLAGLPLFITPAADRPRVVPLAEARALAGANLRELPK